MVHCNVLWYTIGVGAGPADLVLAGPLFWRFNEIHCRYLRSCRYRRCAIHTCLLQADHFKSPSYAPVYCNYYGILCYTVTDCDAICSDAIYCGILMCTCCSRGSRMGRMR